MLSDDRSRQSAVKIPRASYSTIPSHARSTNSKAGRRAGQLQRRREEGSARSHHGHVSRQPLMVELYRKVARSRRASVRAIQCRGSRRDSSSRMPPKSNCKYVNPIYRMRAGDDRLLHRHLGRGKHRALTNVDHEKLSIHKAARKPMFDIFMKRAAHGELKWCGTQFPTQALGAGCGDEPERIRRFRLQRGPARSARSGRIVEKNQRAPAAARRFPQRQERLPRRRRQRHRRAHERRRPHLDQLRRPRKFPRRRSLHRPGHRSASTA